MKAADFVQSLTGFVRLSFVEQIKRFCWFLECRQSKELITGLDVSKCYNEASLPKPTSVPPFLVSLAKQKPPSPEKKGRIPANKARERTI